jgi:hypothetical protein
MVLSLTQGLDFSPAPFSVGLDKWSSSTGTTSTDTYDIVGEAVYVPVDQDFAGCIKMVKTYDVQKLRYTGQTDLPRETYLMIKTRVKRMAGGIPAIRIAGHAIDTNDTHVDAVTAYGPTGSLTDLGEIYEVTAIVGPGLRDGVDMVWGALPHYGHFGIDITGPTGAVVRIDDITIEDVSHIFQRDALNIVDVRDYGAIADGVTDNYNAFVAADNAANGRRVIVPTGEYAISQSLSISSHVEFQGTLVMPESAALLLTKSYDLPTYIDAFGDEAEGFKKAFQALLNSSDHDSLDMGGRTVTVSEPIDMQAAVSTRDTFTQRRVIRNGQFYASGSLGWEPTIVQGQASYSINASRDLTNVENIADIEVGSLVEGAGVGREVYVTSKDVSGGSIRLSKPLYDAAGYQLYTFTRHKYLLDFSGFSTLSKLNLQNIEFQCKETANAVMLARVGLIFHMIDCFIKQPKYRGITSIGTGCQGMLIDRCHFVTAEAQTNATDRVSLGLNANNNDVKLRDNWASQFRHFALLAGSNNIITGNHFYQGDGVQGGARLAGIILTKAATSSSIVGNYVDNCFIEWTNEHDETPDFTSGFGFSSLSISGNNFLSGAVAPWFNYILIKPYGTNHGISNLSVTNNNFRSINGSISRVEWVDTTYADINRSRLEAILFEGNNFENISRATQNPLIVEHTQSSANSVWTLETNNELPFQSYAKRVTALAPQAQIKTSSNSAYFDIPYTTGQVGSDKDQVKLTFGTLVKGKMAVTVRRD